MLLKSINIHSSIIYLSVKPSERSDPVKSVNYLSFMISLIPEARDQEIYTGDTKINYSLRDSFHNIESFLNPEKHFIIKKSEGKYGLDASKKHLLWH